MHNENGNAHLIFYHFLGRIVTKIVKFWNKKQIEENSTGNGVHEHEWYFYYTLAGRVYRYRTTMNFPTNFRTKKIYAKFEDSVFFCWVWKWRNITRCSMLDAYDDFPSRICIRLRIAADKDRWN